jgi:hypothetical protein
MDRRWIRIDRAHRTFDCSSSEFDALLVEARSQDGPSGLSGNAFGPVKSDIERLEADVFLIQEAINAELALLANLQRRDRIIRMEQEQAEEARNRAQLGQILADQHAELLQYTESPRQD